MQQQPDFAQQASESQQHWSIAQHWASPLVQVMQTPSGVHSHLQLPQQRLHWQTVMPFQVQVQQQSPPASDRQRFCKVAQAISSSHLQ